MEYYNPLIAHQETATKELKPLDLESLKQREGMEANPENYRTEIYPPELGGYTSSNFVKKFGELGSGYIDFRNTAENSGSADKNIIWIGNNHYEIMRNGAKFPDDLNLKDYIVGLKTRYDKERRKFQIIKSLNGQSCQRTEEHLMKVTNAAEQALNRDLIQNNPDIQNRFLLEDYGLGSIENISERSIYSEVEFPGIKSQKLDSGNFDLILLSQETENSFTDPASVENLVRKISENLPKLSKMKQASIRIPYKLSTNTEDPDEIYNLESRLDEFIHRMESIDPKIICTSMSTRRAHKEGDLPGESWGYMMIYYDTE